MEQEKNCRKWPDYMIRKHKRILKDFPWLWVVSYIWIPDMTNAVIIKSAKSLEFTTGIDRQNDHVWIKTKSTSLVERVIKIERIDKMLGVAGLTIPEIVTRSNFVAADEDIEYIVLKTERYNWGPKEYAPKIIIFRPPKNQTLKEYLKFLMAKLGRNKWLGRNK